MGLAYMPSYTFIIGIALYGKHRTLNMHKRSNTFIFAFKYTDIQKACAITFVNLTMSRSLILYSVTSSASAKR